MFPLKSMRFLLIGDIQSRVLDLRFLRELCGKSLMTTRMASSLEVCCNAAAAEADWRLVSSFGLSLDVDKEFESAGAAVRNVAELFFSTDVKGIVNWQVNFLPYALYYSHKSSS